MSAACIIVSFIITSIFARLLYVYLSGQFGDDDERTKCSIATLSMSVLVFCLMFGSLKTLVPIENADSFFDGSSSGSFIPPSPAFSNTKPPSNLSVSSRDSLETSLPKTF